MESSTTLARPSRLWAVLLVALLALALRLVILPYATSDGGDSASRVWLAMDWMARPRLLSSGIWGPLHFYLIALALAIHPDPVSAPVIMSVLLATAGAVLMYWFVDLEFGSRRAALLTALTFAVYSVAVRNSVSVRSETPFTCFVLLTFVALALARREGGTWRHAIAGGIALTLAAMLRYEAWLLIPLLGIFLWKKPKLMLAFVAFALIHPVFWMIGNWRAFGDPLFGITAAARFELVAMGRERYGRGALLLRALSYPGVVLRGMGCLVALVAAAGAVLALARRERVAIWLLPLAGLLGLLCLSIARGSLVPKLNYAETAGTMLFPFSALVYDRLNVERWKTPVFAAVAVGLLLSSALSFCKDCLAKVHLASLASSPIPRVENQELALQLPPIIRASLPDSGAALISDNIGFGATSQVAIRTDLPRPRMYLVCRVPNRGSDDGALARFIERHPRGVLLALSGSRFSEAFRIAPTATSVTVGPLHVTLDRVKSIEWPGPPPSQLTIFRFAVPGRSAAPAADDDLAGGSAPGCSPSSMAVRDRDWRS